MRRDVAPAAWGAPGSEAAAVMAGRLTLVCAAASAGLRQLRFPSGEPPDASAVGQASALRPLLPHTGRAWSSPDPAALATAAALGLAAAQDDALREVDHGRWRGRKLAAVALEEPDAFALWLRDPAAAPHGGESRAAAFARVSAWLGERIGEPGEAIVVAGPTVVRMMILSALDAGLAGLDRIDVEPLARVTLASDGRRFRLRLGAVPPP